MLRPEEVERLSQLLAGELGPVEAEALRAQLAARPELAQAWERLQALATLSLPVAGVDPLVERALARAVPRSRARPWRFVAIAASVLVCAAAGYLAWPMPPKPAEFAVTFLQVGAARVEVWPGAVVRQEGERVVRLVQGSAVFDGDLTVLTGNQTVEVRGRALITTEPSQALSHVTSSVGQTPEADQMLQSAKAQWAVAALAVMVFSGEADAQGKVSAGQHWAKPPGQVAVLKALPKAGVTPLMPGELFDLNQVNQAVLQQGGTLSRCFEAGLKQNPALEGQLTLLLRITAAGQLAEATVDGDYSLQNPFVAACVLEALGKVRFPGPRSVEWAQLSYPIQFAARGTASEVLLPQGANSPRKMLVSDREGTVAIELGSSPSQGPADAKVTVVLFSDAECSFCVSAQGVLRQLRADYAGRVRFVYKHRPLAMHKSAYAAAVALQAAHAQGRFWDLLDHVNDQPVTSEPGLYDSQARALGLDLQRFRRDVEDPATGAAVDADNSQAERIEVRSVPTWFVNGKEVVGHRPLEAMRAFIDAALASPP